MGADEDEIRQRNTLETFLLNRIAKWSLTPQFVKDWINEACQGKVVGSQWVSKELYRVTIEWNDNPS